MENTIRKLTVNNFVPLVGENRKPTGQLMPLNLVVGVEHSIFLESENITVKRRICAIERTENAYLIYLEEGSERQLWKRIPKTNECVEEYKID